MCIFFLGLLIVVMSVHSKTEDEPRMPGDHLPPLGRSMRAEFYMEPNFVQLNHGSYGTYPKVVGKALREYHILSEKNPDLWLRRDVKKELARVRGLLAKLINAQSEDVVMVPNTTTGITAILRSMVFARGERILHLNTIYGSMASIIQYVIDYSDGAVSKVVFNVTYPLTNAEFLEKFEGFLNEIHDPKQPIRIALVDHISSVPAVVVPIEDVIPMLKQRNITVLIDGAHAIGQVPIDIQSLDPDYYVTSCHKWLYAARGCALMYVKKIHQSTIHAAIINAGYQQPSDFQNEFFWTGTMDYSQYMSVFAALQFRQNVGGEQVIRTYNHNLAFNGGHVMASRFGTRILQDQDQLGSMVDVQLPLDNPDDPVINAPEWWVDIQLYKYPNIFSPVYKHNGQWWVRVSAQIYNDITDFERSAQHFLQICHEINTNATDKTREEQF